MDPKTAHDELIGQDASILGHSDTWEPQPPGEPMPKKPWTFTLHPKTTPAPPLNGPEVKEPDPFLGQDASVLNAQPGMPKMSPADADAYVRQRIMEGGHQKPGILDTIPTEFSQGASKEWFDELSGKAYAGRNYLRNLLGGTGVAEAQKRAQEASPSGGLGDEQFGVQNSRRFRQEAREENPKTAALSNMAGGYAGDYALNALTGGALNNPLGQALLGGVTGAGASNGPLLSKETAVNTGVGALLGGGLGKLGEKYPRELSKALAVLGLGSAAAGGAEGKDGKPLLSEADRWQLGLTGGLSGILSLLSGASRPIAERAGEASRTAREELEGPLRRADIGKADQYGNAYDEGLAELEKANTAAGKEKAKSFRKTALEEQRAAQSENDSLASALDAQGAKQQATEADKQAQFRERLLAKVAAREAEDKGAVQAFQSGEEKKAAAQAAAEKLAAQSAKEKEGQFNELAASKLANREAKDKSVSDAFRVQQQKQELDDAASVAAFQRSEDAKNTVRAALEKAAAEQGEASPLAKAISKMGHETKDLSAMARLHLGNAEALDPELQNALKVLEPDRRAAAKALALKYVNGKDARLAELTKQFEEEAAKNAPRPEPTPARRPGLRLDLSEPGETQVGVPAAMEPDTNISGMPAGMQESPYPEVARKSAAFELGYKPKQAGAPEIPLEPDTAVAGGPPQGVPPSPDRAILEDEAAREVGFRPRRAVTPEPDTAVTGQPPGMERGPNLAQEAAAKKLNIPYQRVRPEVLAKQNELPDAVALHQKWADENNSVLDTLLGRKPVAPGPKPDPAALLSRDERAAIAQAAGKDLPASGFERAMKPPDKVALRNAHAVETWNEGANLPPEESTGGINGNGPSKSAEQFAPEFFQGPPPEKDFVDSPISAADWARINKGAPEIAPLTNTPRADKVVAETGKRSAINALKVGALLGATPGVGPGAAMMGIKGAAVGGGGGALTGALGNLARVSAKDPAARAYVNDVLQRVFSVAPNFNDKYGVFLGSGLRAPAHDLISRVRYLLQNDPKFAEEFRQQAGH